MSDISLNKFPVNIEDEMKRSYMDYAMSVIIGRALPDVRDGLKPAHRRVLYAHASDGPRVEPALPQVREGHRRGHRQLPPARRCAGLRHAGAPRAGLQHALRPGRRPGQLRLGRRRSARGVPLHRSTSRGAGRRDDGGSRQGDRRLRPEFRRDDRRADGPADDLPEPARQRLGGHRRRHGHEHPAAQHARSHRRRDRPRCEHRGQPREARLKAVLKTIPGPDFPTGGFIVGRHGIFNAYTTGRGSITLRAKATTEESKKGDKISIVVTEIPYQVNKKRLLENIAELVREKVIEGISDLRDESDRDGMRIVIELKRGEVPEVDPQQPLQAHAAADDVRHHHAGDRRRPPARAAARRHHRALSSSSAARSFGGAPSSSCARPRRAPTSSKA